MKKWRADGGPAWRLHQQDPVSSPVSRPLNRLERLSDEFASVSMALLNVISDGVDCETSFHRRTWRDVHVLFRPMTTPDVSFGIFRAKSITMIALFMDKKGKSHSGSPS